MNMKKHVGNWTKHDLMVQIHHYKMVKSKNEFTFEDIYVNYYKDYDWTVCYFYKNIDQFLNEMVNDKILNVRYQSVKRFTWTYKKNKGKYQRVIKETNWTTQAIYSIN